MRRVFLITIRKRKIIPWIGIVIVLLFAFGASLIVSNNYIMDDVSPRSEVKKDFDYFDKTFGGVRPFELAIHLKDKSEDIWHPDRLKEIEKLETYLSTTYGVNINSSLARYLSLLHRAAYAGDTAYFNVPETKKNIRKYKKMLKTADQGRFIGTILDSSENITRISGSIPDWGNQKTA